MASGNLSRFESAAVPLADAAHPPGESPQGGAAGRSRRPRAKKPRICSTCGRYIVPLREIQQRLAGSPEGSQQMAAADAAKHADAYAVDRNGSMARAFRVGVLLGEIYIAVRALACHTKTCKRGNS